MKADYIYFGYAGMTSTSANHAANMAKESVRHLMDELAGVSFYSTKVGLLSGGDAKQSKVGNTPEQLANTDYKLNIIGEAHALIAWLREAIKARERLLAEVKDMTLAGYCKTVLGGAAMPKADTNITDWMKEKGYTKPDINGEFPDVEYKRSFGMVVAPMVLFCKKFGLKMPDAVKKQEPMTIDDYMAELSVKDRNRMLLLEAKAAVIGKFIHEDGKLDKERKSLREVLSHPVGTHGEGASMLIYQFEPTVTQEFADEMFFRLAAEHRAIQAELNGMLAERDRTIEADKQAKAAEFQKATAEFSREMSVLQDKLSAYLLEEQRKLSKMQDEYNAWSMDQKSRHQQLCADMETWKLAEAKRIAALGIIIPNELRPVYEWVNSLGKTK